MRVSRLKLCAAAALPLLLAVHPASAEDALGSSALALSALVAANSPALSASDRGAMATLFDGRLDAPFPAGKKISIQADRIVCRAGDVDITLHSCNFTFGKKTATLTGRAAHEFAATMIEVGVRMEGAAGSMFAAISNLDCTVDPNQVKQQNGDGAACKFDAD